MLLTQLPRTVKIAVITGAALTFLLVLQILDESPFRPLDVKNAEALEVSTSLGPAENDLNKGEGSPGAETPPCRNLPGSEDVLVVMRTGASEIKDKLPVRRIAVSKVILKIC